jgi:hypothetical protein
MNSGESSSGSRRASQYKPCNSGAPGPTNSRTRSVALLASATARALAKAVFTLRVGEEERAEPTPVDIDVELLLVEACDIDLVGRQPRKFPRLGIAVGPADAELDRVAIGFTPQTKLQLEKVHIAISPFADLRPDLTGLMETELTSEPAISVFHRPLNEIRQSPLARLIYVIGNGLPLVVSTPYHEDFSVGLKLSI